MLGGYMNKILVLVLLCTIWSLDGYAEGTIPSYRNVVTGIQEIHGHSTYSLVLTTQIADPIINYAPSSYQESFSDAVYRAFMPNTSVADGVTNASGVWKATDHGVEIILLGKLKLKLITDNVVLLTINIPEEK